MKKAIAVVGSAVQILDEGLKRKAQAIGKEIALRGYVLLTGACPGFPLEAARGAKQVRGTVIGISPANNYEEHRDLLHYPIEEFDFIMFPGIGKARNFLIVRSASAVVVLGGRIGTLNEFTIAYDEGKIIGILRGLPGISEYLEKIVGWAKKDTNAKIVSSADPEELISKISALIQSELQ